MRLFFCFRAHPTPHTLPTPPSPHTHNSVAYYKAAKAFDELTEALPSDGAVCLARVKALTKAKTLTGVGKGTLAKLEEWFDKGTCDALTEDAGGEAAPLESAALAFA